MSHMDTRKIVTVAVSTVAAGAAAYGVYALVRNRRRAVGAAKQAVVTPAVTIEKKHIDYIGDKAQEYCGGDRDAVVRVILDYASTQGDEKLIFETVRCNTCGGKKDKAAHEASISVTHDTYLGAMAVKHNLKDGKSKALRVVLEFVMTDGDVADIFTKERCDAWATPPP